MPTDAPERAAAAVYIGPFVLAVVAMSQAVVGATAEAVGNESLAHVGYSSAAVLSVGVVAGLAYGLVKRKRGVARSGHRHGEAAGGN